MAISGKGMHVYFSAEAIKVIDTLERGILSSICNQAVLSYAGIIRDKEEITKQLQEIEEKRAKDNQKELLLKNILGSIQSKEQEEQKQKELTEAEQKQKESQEYINSLKQKLQRTKKYLLDYFVISPEDAENEASSFVEEEPDLLPGWLGYRVYFESKGYEWRNKK